MTYTHGPARRLARLRDSGLIGALALAAACATSDPTETEAPAEPPAGLVQSLDVTPHSVTVDTNQLISFRAFGPKGRRGEAAPVPVHWSASGGSITEGGVYTAGADGGTFTVTAASEGRVDTSTVTVTAGVLSQPVVPAPAPLPLPTPIPLGNSSCLERSPGPRMTISGRKTSRYDSRKQPIPAQTTVDARGASWIGAIPFPVDIGAQPGVCWYGGLVQGTLPPTTSWSTYHSTAASYVVATDIVIEGLRVDNYGDGIRFTPPGTRNWTLRRAYFSDIHDDCVENDRLETGTIEDSFFDGCYVAFSARPGKDWLPVRGETNTWTITGSLVRLKPFDAVYRGPVPGHGGFFKWDEAGPQLSLHNNVFRVDQRPNHGGLGIPSGKLASCSNNIIVWLGQGDYPSDLPSCFTVTRDKSVWDNAVAEWMRRQQ